MSQKNKDEHLNELVHNLNKSRLAKEVMKNEELREAAKDIKVMYDAYVESGFTNQEAMQLITAMLMGGPK